MGRARRGPTVASCSRPHDRSAARRSTSAGVVPPRLFIRNSLVRRASTTDDARRMVRPGRAPVSSPFSKMRDTPANVSGGDVAGGPLDHPAAVAGEIVYELGRSHLDLVEVDQVHVGAHAWGEHATVVEAERAGWRGGELVDGDLRDGRAVAPASPVSIHWASAVVGVVASQSPRQWAPPSPSPGRLPGAESSRARDRRSLRRSWPRRRGTWRSHRLRPSCRRTRPSAQPTATGLGADAPLREGLVVGRVSHLIEGVEEPGPGGEKVVAFARDGVPNVGCGETGRELGGGSGGCRDLGERGSRSNRCRPRGSSPRLAGGRGPGGRARRLQRWRPRSSRDSPPPIWILMILYERKGDRRPTGEAHAAEQVGLGVGRCPLLRAVVGAGLVWNIPP